MLNKTFFLVLFFALSNFYEAVNLVYAQDWHKVNTGGFGDKNNAGSSVNSVVFNDCLYVGTSNKVTGCEVWRYDGATWTQVNTNGFGDANNTGASFMVVYNGYLYVGTENGTDENVLTGCEVWKTAAVGGPPFTDWTQVNSDGFGDANNTTALGMTTYSGSLYVGTENRVTGSEIWQYNGSSWSQRNTNGFGSANNVETIEMVVYRDFLYAGTHNGSGGTRVYRYNGGTTWTQVNTDGFGDAYNEESFGMVEYNDCLYVGTTNENTGAEVWKYDGASWTQINIDGFGDANNNGGPGLIVYNNHLYAGTFPAGPPAELWSYNGSAWTQVTLPGFDDVNNRSVSPIGVYRDCLYVGTDNDITGVEVWRLCNSCSYTDSDGDGVPDLWDNCPNTPLNSYVNKYGCPGLIGDINGDGKIGLEEAIRALQAVSGLKVQ